MRFSQRRLLLAGFLAVALFAAAAGGASGQTANSPIVYSIDISGTIDEGLAVYVQRTVRSAEQAGADALLVVINTFGGRVDSSTAIRDQLMGSRLPVIAYVSERAWSAGALIALSAEHLVMAPGASIGAAEPQPAEEKTISALRAEFEAMAEARGRDPRIAAAMVDRRVAVEGVSPEGQILTLSAQRALELGFIDALADSSAQALALFGFAGAEVRETQPNWAERVARFLTDPTISSLLLALGFLGLLAEVTTPGWGVPGTAGLVALALFFGARYITGLAGLEVALLFLLGLGLLLLELLVIPGFGVAGALGIGAVVVSLFLSFPDVSSALTSIAIAAVVTVVGAIFILRRVPDSKLWRRLSLETRLEEPGVEGDDRNDPVIKVGARGKALSPLRPSGTVQIANFRLDAVSDGSFIPAGAEVEIVRIVGSRITVREAPAGD